VHDPEQVRHAGIIARVPHKSPKEILDIGEYRIGLFLHGRYIRYKRYIAVQNRVLRVCRPGCCGRS